MSPHAVSPRSPAVFFRALRTFHGWSREELAHRAQLTPSRIVRLEAGAVPTAEELDALWRVFNAERRPLPAVEESAR